MQVENIGEHHKSRERIRDLGEVFTQEKYVEEMLDLLGKSRSNIWTDIGTTFFEPCCGHGNIVMTIAKRRLRAMFSRSTATKEKNPSLYSIANTINTIWAVDIDPGNIHTCRERLLTEVCSFAVHNSRETNLFGFLSEHQKFMAHILCAINWQINENEVLSALSEKKAASEKASLTKLGSVWFAENGHHQLDLQNTWVTYFRECVEEGSTPMLFEKAERFIRDTLAGKRTESKEFRFAKGVFQFGKQTGVGRTQEQVAG